MPSFTADEQIGMVLTAHQVWLEILSIQLATLQSEQHPRDWLADLGGKLERICAATTWKDAPPARVAEVREEMRRLARSFGAAILDRFQG